MAFGNDYTFRNKTAVVTGAASGIGRALTLDLAGRGCDLVILDVQAGPLDEVAELAERKGVRVTHHIVDMGDHDAIKAFAQTLSEEVSRVDLLFNNAGVALGGNFEEVSDEEFAWLMDINFYGVVRMTRALLPMLKSSPDAHIANVSSVYGMIAPPGQSAYVSSKFAVRGFSEVLRHELADTSVGVSVIHPGGIKTAIARTARVAEKVLESARAKEVNREVAQMEKNFITTPEKAAEIILDGVRKRKARIMVGPDARLIEILERIFPTSNIDVLARLFNI